MKKVNKQFIDKLLLIIMSIQTILLGILFIVQVCRIYFANDGNFTWDICSMYLKEILIVIILWVILIISCWIYFTLKGTYKEKGIKFSNVRRLENLMRIAPLSGNDSFNKEYKEIEKNLNMVKIVKYITVGIVVICSLMGIGYLSNIKHFDSSGNPNTQIKAMMLHLMPWLIISALAVLGMSIYEEYSAKKTIELVKLIIKNDGKRIHTYHQNKKKELVINIARGVIICVAISLIVVGCFDGGAQDVLQKAINICTECIGLG